MNIKNILWEFLFFHLTFIQMLFFLENIKIIVIIHLLCKNVRIFKCFQLFFTNLEDEFHCWIFFLPPVMLQFKSHLLSKHYYSWRYFEISCIHIFKNTHISNQIINVCCKMLTEVCLAVLLKLLFEIQMS